MSEEKRIGNITSYYGGILAKEEGGKFYWGLEDHRSTNWEEIPYGLYIELIKLEVQDE